MAVQPYTRGGTSDLGSSRVFCKMLFLLVLIVVVYSKNWAVLVAGSNTYSNFRHQADVCQAYQEIHSAGIPKERIIVWMYDDIAHNPENPHPGSIINYIGGPNVYPGVPHDYTGEDVIPENFLKMLRGEDMSGIGSGKSLKSGPDDNVFIYFTDHGGPGVICFPGFIELHVSDLMDALQYAHNHKIYKEMVFYMEACESGSMFYNHLQKDWHIYGVTASNPTESSWACDWSSEYEAYLNDCWSRDWLNDTRWALNNHMMGTRTLEEQFKWVKKQSTKSPECKYGDTSIWTQVLENFQGEASFDAKTDYAYGEKTDEAVSPHDVKLRSLEKKGDNGLIEEYKLHRHRMDLRWGAFARHFELMPPPKNYDTCETDDSLDFSCMKEMVEGAKRSCGRFDEYSSKYYNHLADACRAGVAPLKAEEQLKLICEVV